MKQNQRILLTNCELSSKTRLALLRALGPKFVIRNADSLRDNELGQVEIMLFDTVRHSDREWLTRDKIGRMPMLKLIQSIRAGVDALNFENIPEKVIVCGNVGAYSESIAEFAIGMILYLAKDLGNRNSKLKLGIPDYEDSLLLRGKTIGIIGAGGIGQAVARIAKCLGMTTIGVNSSGKPAKFCDETFAVSRLNHVLTISDVVVLALPLTVETFHIINKKELQSMKKNCILVNLGRGYVINEKALYNHLRNNPRFRCGLDVWWHYPKAGEKFEQKLPFLELPNFMGTAHVSGFVPEQMGLSVEYAVQNIARFAKKQKLNGMVDREHYAGLRELINNARAG